MLTQTTEDHLRSHCETFFANFEDKKDKYTSRISDAVGIFLDGNPYTDRDWKKHEPTRHYKDLITWFGENEADVQEYMSFQFFLSDLTVLARHFKWDELDDVKFEVEKFISHMVSGQKDLAQLEEMRFTQAKKKFQEENKEWIEEQELLKKHKSSHYSAHYWRTTQEEGGNMEKCLACKFCKEECDREVQKFKETREYEVKQRELHPEFYIIKTDIVKKEVQELYISPVEKSCEDCGYKTNNSAAFEVHKHQPDHKRAVQLKAWYCEACDVQSRTELEYKNHIITKKHEKKINGETEYHCEKCNYKTLLKHLYDQHCTTIKHKETE
jgi:ferredoxin